MNDYKLMIYFMSLGAAYSRAEKNINKLINQTGFPFLPTPMAKGLLPDDHELCVSPARSR